MRRYLFFLLLMASFAIQAQDLSKGKLSISTTGSNKIYVELGDTKKTLEQRDLIWYQLTPGTYSVKIYRLIRNDLATDQWKNYDLICNRTIEIRSGYHMEITINRFGNFFINELNITGYDDFNEWNAATLVNNDPWVYGIQNTTGAPGSGNDGYAMKKSNFIEFKKLMQEQSFDSKIVDFFKRNSKNNLFTAQQIKELCSLLSFDKYKLDLAKFAYDFTVDKGNYFLLYSVFDFDSYKRSLESYIKSK
ncbi:MAG: DUF4476 domain-containing protein [Lacibacter sp.]